MINFALLKKLDIFYNHCFISCFAHVVNGEQSNAHGLECFHFRNDPFRLICRQRARVSFNSVTLPKGFLSAYLMSVGLSGYLLFDGKYYF